MVFLLDANVLIALIDPAHIQHDAAHAWFAAHGQPAWATCPLTENAVLRIVGHHRYPNSPGTPAAVTPLMARLCALPGHIFWPDDISLLDPGRLAPGHCLVPPRSRIATCWHWPMPMAASWRRSTAAWSPALCRTVTKPCT
jgi:hypothetical protein